MSITTYFYYVWQVITNALWFNPKVVEIVEAYPNTFWITLGVAILGGISLLLGQSIILFINRVRPGRFVVSLLLNGILYTLSLVVWAASIWLIGDILLNNIDIDFSTALRIMFVTAAPMTLGFLVLMPYLGTPISKVLHVWSLLLTIGVVRFQYHVGLTTSLIIVGLGWLLILLMTFTIGRPVVYARNAVWHRIVGSPMDANPEDILLTFSDTQGGKAVKRD